MLFMSSQEEHWLLEEKYHGEKNDAFFADCKKLALGEPLGYLIGWVPFLDCRIYLDSRPLIPRPETEAWTEQAISVMQKSQTGSLGFADPTALAVLDLCAGSGCIGVAVAKAFPTAHVDFAEIDATHLPTIMKNLDANGIELERATLIQSNLFTEIDTHYDFILANPPYIDPALTRVDESVTVHEPHLALFGGHDGMDVITEIITQAPHSLRSGGQLWLEHEPEQTSHITTLGEAHGFNVSTHTDQYQRERYSILVLQ